MWGWGAGGESGKERRNTRATYLSIEIQFVTGSEKRAHFAQEVKIELLVLKG